MFTSMNNLINIRDSFQEVMLFYSEINRTLHCWHVHDIDVHAVVLSTNLENGQTL